MLSIGSLFSGIGGLERGLELAGLGPVRYQVESDETCRKVLERHWPKTTRYEDIRYVDTAELEPVDLVCGGFPCQDISDAGKRRGLGGPSSSLWDEFYRVVRDTRPRYVAAENVSAIVRRGMPTILRQMAALGYDAWWDCIRASDVGAPHRRERWFAVFWLPVAHADGKRKLQRSELVGQIGSGSQHSGRRTSQSTMDIGIDGISSGLVRLWPAEKGKAPHSWEPPRKAALVRGRRAQLRAIGNAVVPQCAYIIGTVVRELEYGNRRTLAYRADNRVQNK